MMMTYSHKGWIGICPIYIGNVNHESPDVLPRLPMTDWFLILNLWIFDVVAKLSMIDDDGSIPIRITGKLNEPITNKGGTK